MKILRRDKDGFIRNSVNWERVLIYPAYKAPVRGVHLYKTKDDFPLQYSFLAKPNDPHSQTFAWPVDCALRPMLHDRVGQTHAIRFGIVLPDGECEWRKLGDFPQFKDHHRHPGVGGLPDYVLTSRHWEPVVRRRVRDKVDDDEIPF